MAKKTQGWVVTLLLVFLVGWQWGLVQSVAWASMLIRYSAQGSFRDAVTQTFDGKHPCPLCRLAESGDESESPDRDEAPTTRLEGLAADPVVGLYPPPTERPVRRRDSSPPASFTEPSEPVPRLA